MKVSTRRKAIFAGLFLVVVLCIVWVSQNKTLMLRSGVKNTTNDSLYNAFDQLPKGKYEATVAREQVKAFYAGNEALYADITAYFQKRADMEDNRVALAYIKSNKASLMVQSQPDSAIILARDAMTYLEDTNNVGWGNIYNTMANSHYFIGNIDSAKYYMTRGYLFGTTHQLDVFVSTFAINLGTLYYDQMLYGAAAYYFYSALEAAKREQKVPLMLINNITSILSVERHYSEADSLWNIYLKDMQNVKDPYEHQLYFISRVLHLQNMGRLNESRVIYSQYAPDDIYEVLRVPYLHAMLNQSLYDDKEQAAVFFKKYKHWLGQRYVPAINELFIELTELLEVYPSILPIDTIIQWEKDFNQELVNDPKAASHSNKLKSIIAHKKGNTQLAYQYLEKSRLNDIEFDQKSDSLHHADFFEKNQLSKLKEDINLANLKLEQSQKDKRYTNYLWMLSLLVLICFIIALLFALSYRKTKLDYATEQINFMRAEEDYLTKEQELNTRIVNLSQLIVLKAQDLGKKIKLVGSDDKEALHEVKKEIDELSRLGIEEKPQLADKLMDSHQTVFSKFPDFAENGNLTEKRIFILSIDGYKPKEIANVVGVSIQYVHNVRTRLRKKLSIDNNTEWESLKKM